MSSNGPPVSLRDLLKGARPRNSGDAIITRSEEDSSKAPAVTDPEPSASPIGGTSTPPPPTAESPREEVPSQGNSPQLSPQSGRHAIEDPPSRDDAASESTASRLLGDSAVGALGAVLAFVPSADLLLAAKYVSSRLHAAAFAELERRLVASHRAAPDAVLIGDTFTLTDVTVTRYDQELLGTAACRELLDGPRPVPTYFVADHTAVGPGRLVDGILAGPAAQLLFPAPKPSARAAAQRLRLAKIVGTFYVGPRAGSPEASSFAPLPYLYRGCCLLATGVPLSVAGVASGTAISAAVSLTGHVDAKCLSSLSPRNHTHAELSFAGVMVHPMSGPGRRKGPRAFQQVAQVCLYVETQHMGDDTATPHVSFSIAAGEHRSPSEVRRFEDRITAFGCAAVPTMPMALESVLAASPGPRQPLGLFSSTVPLPPTRSRTAAVSMLALEGTSPAAKAADPWLINVAVLVDGATNPALFLRDVPLSAPVSEVRQRLVATAQASGEAASIPIGPDVTFGVYSSVARRCLRRILRDESTVSGSDDVRDGDPPLVLPPGLDVLPLPAGPYVVRLTDLLPYSRAGAFSAQLLAAAPHVLQSKGAADGNWPRGVSCAGGRALVVVIHPSTQRAVVPHGISAVHRARNVRSTRLRPDGAEALGPYLEAFGAAHEACAAGDLRTLEALLDAKSTAPAAKSKALGRAAAGPTAALVVDDCGALGMALLHTACYHGRGAVIRLLLEHGASVFVTNTSGKLPIHICAERGHAECLPLLLRGTGHGALATISAQDHAGRTPLHLCLAMRFLNTALWLVEQGADVCTLRDSDGYTCADVACRLHPTVADLCRAGDHKGAILALLAGTQDATEYAAEARRNNPSLTGASLEQVMAPFYVSVLRHRLTDGRLVADLYGSHTVNQRHGTLVPSTTRNTALHEAIQQGHGGVLHALLFHPRIGRLIDLFAANAAGDTILHTAAAASSQEMVQIVLAAAARTHTPADEDASGERPQENDACRLLRMRNHRGCTPLHILVRRQCTACVAWLLQWVEGGCGGGLSDVGPALLQALLFEIPDVCGLTVGHYAAAVLPVSTGHTTAEEATAARIIGLAWRGGFVPRPQAPYATSSPLQDAFQRWFPRKAARFQPSGSNSTPPITILDVLLRRGSPALLRWFLDAAGRQMAVALDALVAEQCAEQECGPDSVELQPAAVRATAEAAWPVSLLGLPSVGSAAAAAIHCGSLPKFAILLSPPDLGGLGTAPSAALVREMLRPRLGAEDVVTLLVAAHGSEWVDAILDAATPLLVEDAVLAHGLLAAIAQAHATTAVTLHSCVTARIQHPPGEETDVHRRVHPQFRNAPSGTLQLCNESHVVRVDEVLGGPLTESPPGKRSFHPAGRQRSSAQSSSAKRHLEGALVHRLETLEWALQELLARVATLLADRRRVALMTAVVEAAAICVAARPYAGRAPATPLRGAWEVVWAFLCLAESRCPGLQGYWTDTATAALAAAHHTVDYQSKRSLPAPVPATASSVGRSATGRAPSRGKAGREKSPAAMVRWVHHSPLGAAARRRAQDAFRFLLPFMIVGESAAGLLGALLQQRWFDVAATTVSWFSSAVYRARSTERLLLPDVHWRSAAAHEGLPPLHTAAAHGSEALVTALLATGQFGVDDRTTAFLAAPPVGGLPEADPSRCRSRGCFFGSLPLILTPLHLACANGHAAVCRLLLARGASALAVAEPLVRDELRPTTLHLSAASGDVPTLRAILDDSRVRHAHGSAHLLTAADGAHHQRHPLHHAAARGHTDAVLHLLQAGAPLWATTADGSTAAILAARSGHGSTVSALADFWTSSGGGRDDLLRARHPTTQLNLAHCGMWWVRSPSMLGLLGRVASLDARNAAIEADRAGKAKVAQRRREQEEATLRTHAARALDERQRLGLELRRAARDEVALAEALCGPVACLDYDAVSSLAALECLPAMAPDGPLPPLLLTERLARDVIAACLPVVPSSALPRQAPRLHDPDAASDQHLSAVLRLAACDTPAHRAFEVLNAWTTHATAALSVGPRPSSKSVAALAPAAESPLEALLVPAATPLFAALDVHAFPSATDGAITTRVAAVQYGRAQHNSDALALAPSASMKVLFDNVVCESAAEVAAAEATAKAEAEQHRRAQVFPVLPPAALLVADRNLVETLVEACEAEVNAPVPPPPAPRPVFWGGYYGRDGAATALGVPFALVAAPPSDDGGERVDDFVERELLRALSWLLPRADAYFPPAGLDATPTTPEHRHMAAILASLRGVDARVGGPCGPTALMAAAFRGQLNAVCRLLQRGADVNARARLRAHPRDAGVTPLIAAVLGGSEAVAAKLLESGADPDASDECGNTALHHAVRAKDLSMTKLLLRFGARMDATNHVGHVPEDIAVGLRHRVNARVLFWWRLANLIPPGAGTLQGELRCSTAVEFADWLAEATAFYRRIDAMADDYITLANTDEQRSMAAICYARVCARAGSAAQQCVMAQLVPHWFPDEVRRLELSDVHFDDASLTALLTFAKMAPALEALDFTSSSLTNGNVAQICAAVAEHPSLRHITLCLNKYVTSPTAIERLLAANPRIVTVDLANTGISPAAQLKITRLADANRRALAAAYQQYSQTVTRTTAASRNSPVRKAPPSSFITSTHAAATPQPATAEPSPM